MGVSGISTGALAAPFAFLGSAYDPKLRGIYTNVARRDVLRSNGLLDAIFFNDSLADNAPLRRTVARYVDQSMLEAIAAEYRKGRLLFIGTTDLDARRPVIWDIGKIANSGQPEALDLVRNILIASAAVPGFFPPVMIDVEVDGKHYQEMHVDGGASTQVFLYPPSLNVREIGSAQERRLYVIRNARLGSDWTQVDRATLSIASRAISSLIQTQGIGDLNRIYLITQHDGFDFNLAYIPKSFTRQLKEAGCTGSRTPTPSLTDIPMPSPRRTGSAISVIRPHLKAEIIRELDRIDLVVAGAVVSMLSDFTSASRSASTAAT